MEILAPEDVNKCVKCELCKQRGRVIWGEGNKYASVMLILDNPGTSEYNEGIPFVCKTRKILQDAVRLSGLKEEDIYLTFILKCRPVRKYDKISLKHV